MTTGTTDSGEAFIAVRDTGSGIEPEHRSRIFDAFFTTKPGVGTGLGLAICQQVVRSVGGRIELESETGVGSTFRVVLPAANRSVAASGSSAARAVKPAAGPRRRLLVVDDEQAIGSSVRRLLSDFEIDAVTNGQAALDHLAARTYDIILCDVHMPDMSGPQLFEEVRARAPEVANRFVFMTGGDVSSGGRDEVDRIARPLIEKPFDSESLRAALARVR